MLAGALLIVDILLTELVADRFFYLFILVFLLLVVDGTEKLAGADRGLGAAASICQRPVALVAHADLLGREDPKGCSRLQSGGVRNIKVPGGLCR